MLSGGGFPRRGQTGRLVFEMITENEKRIVTLLYKRGFLSKQELAEEGHMGWATVVKLVNRLVDKGIVRCIGQVRRVVRRGRSAELYALTNSNPLAVGIDMEYRTTTTILTNLSGEVLAENVNRSPENPDSKQLRSFFKRVVGGFLDRFVYDKNALAGIGIGIPGIGIPSWLVHEKGGRTEELASLLEDEFQYKVRIDNNVRAYTVYEKWHNQTLVADDFILVSIRTGVGSGIFLQGNLWRGTQGLAGEIGHFKVVPGGLPCRCGGRGCLETLVNQHRLVELYRQRAPAPSKGGAAEEHRDPLQDLEAIFTDAAQGDPLAREIVEQTAGYLGHACSHMIMTLNVPNIVISGYFGPNGGIIAESLKKEMSKNVLSKMDFSVSYLPFEERGHCRGAALLVLKDYFTGIPLK